MNQDSNIQDRFVIEISNIENRLNKLENGHIKEIQGAGYPYLSTQTQKLREEIFSLLTKIENGSLSGLEEMTESIKNSKL
ncbi:hypothetical protein Q0N12_16310 [Rossellomorea marisflavi]|uniref:hypothetical protein n=1 Tax=Rossellomorea marisflavi TaxID=189381 RepID=UPI0034574F10